jgi:hypothetical protein
MTVPSPAVSNEVITADIIRPRRDLILIYDLIRLARHVYGRLLAGISFLVLSTYCIMLQPKN